jgi:hypothetical protein
MNELFMVMMIMLRKKECGVACIFVYLYACIYMCICKGL